MRTGPPRSFANLKPVLRPQVRYRRDYGGAILFDSASMAVYATNPTGLLILRKINGRTSCAEIVKRLQRSFASPSPRTLRRDLHEFLGKLESLGLIGFEA